MSQNTTEQSLCTQRLFCGILINTYLDFSFWFLVFAFFYDNVSALRCNFTKNQKFRLLLGGIEPFCLLVNSRFGCAVCDFIMIAVVFVSLRLQ